MYVLIVTEVLEDWEDSVNIGESLLPQQPIMPRLCLAGAGSEMLECLAKSASTHIPELRALASDVSKQKLRLGMGA